MADAETVEAVATEKQELEEIEHGVTETRKSKELEAHKKAIDANAPPDSFWIIHALFFFLGLLHFIPSSFFSTATKYFMYKFRDVSKGEGITPAADRNYMQKEFGVFNTIFGSVPMIIFMTLTTVYGQGINVRVRITVSTAVMMMTFALSAMFVGINTDSWQVGFYVVTMSFIFLKSAANSVLGVSLFEILSKFPNKYLVWYLTGEGIAGVFNSILQIISLAIGTTIKASALIYFICGTLIVLITLLLFIFAKHTALYKYYIGISDTIPRKKILSWKESKGILKEIWSSIVIFIIMISGLQLISPAITTLVVSEAVGTPWGDTYFLPFTYFLRDFCDLIGRTIASKLPWHMKPWMLATISVVRLSILIPLYLFSNAQPRERLPVYFPYDYQYCFIVMGYSISGGYLFNIAYLNVKRLLPEERVNDAYNVLTTCVGIIGAVTSAFSYLGVNFI